jgi:hypothetical protein
MLVEVVIGIIASSIALISDAGHMAHRRRDDRARARHDALDPTTSTRGDDLRPQARRNTHLPRLTADPRTGAWRLSEGLLAALKSDRCRMLDMDFPESTFPALRCIAFSLRCSGSIYTLVTRAMGPAFRSLYG